MIAVLAAYSSEVYPTRVRLRGAALAALLFGVETRRRGLEEITAAEFGDANPPTAPVA
jgi:hypothetical protein